MSDQESDENIYEVEKIMDHVVVNGELYYWWVSSINCVVVIVRNQEIKTMQGHDRSSKVSRRQVIVSYQPIKT